MQPNPSAGAFNLFFLMGIFAIWYFLLIRPQQKKQKEHQGLVNSLKKNDQVVTSGGIHATIVNVKDKTFVVRVDETAKLEIDKNSIASVIKKKNTE